MHVVCVTVSVVPGGGDAFLEAARRNRAATRQEAGNVRFDVLQASAPVAPDDPEGFLLWEVYHSQDDFTAHQQTAHYLRFRDEVAALMYEPRRGIHYMPVDSDPWQ